MKLPESCQACYDELPDNNQFIVPCLQEQRVSGDYKLLDHRPEDCPIIIFERQIKHDTKY